MTEIVTLEQAFQAAYVQCGDLNVTVNTELMKFDFNELNDDEQAFVLRNNFTAQVITRALWDMAHNSRTQADRNAAYKVIHKLIEAFNANGEANMATLVRHHESERFEVVPDADSLTEREIVRAAFEQSEEGI